ILVVLDLPSRQRELVLRRDDGGGHGFNPCCPGPPFSAGPRGQPRRGACSVSILVVLDLPSRRRAPTSSAWCVALLNPFCHGPPFLATSCTSRTSAPSSFNPCCPGPPFSARLGRSHREGCPEVSILVVLDLPSRRARGSRNGAAMRSFNPCCPGP